MPRLLVDLDEVELKGVMNTLGSALEYVAKEFFDLEKPLFCLVLFNDPEVAQYLANCKRSDVIKAMREMADRLESGETVERESFPDTLHTKEGNDP